LRWRIWQRSRLNNETGCWEWQAAKYPNGYGALKVDGKVQGAHRVAYTVFKGEISGGLDVMHACDNRPCCNPDHLSLGTRSDNMLDMHRKGRAPDRRSRPPAEAQSTLGDMALSHAEAGLRLGVSRDQVRSWRLNMGIDRKGFGGGAEAWKRRKASIYVDDETGAEVTEAWWPGDPIV
jgi:hypothetical protein